MEHEIFVSLKNVETVKLSPRRMIPFQGTALLLSYKASVGFSMKQSTLTTLKTYFPFIIVNLKFST